MKHSDQETGKSDNPEREPLPIEFSEFIASIREFFREIKKFVVFMRNGKNANVLLVFLTFLLAVAAFTQALIYGLQLGPLRHSADAAEKANKAAHDAFTKANRPWVDVESVRITAPIGVIGGGNGKDITYFLSGSLEIVIKNYGNSPALSVSNFIEAYEPLFFNEHFDPTDPFAPLRKAGENACALADGNEFTKKNPRTSGGSIFPTQAITYNTGIPGFSKRNLQVGQFLQLVGCISYGDQFAETIHHTHYCVVAPVGVLGTVNNCESNSDAD